MGKKGDTNITKEARCNWDRICVGDKSSCSAADKKAIIFMVMDWKAFM
jgi:hypothetical protein